MEDTPARARGFACIALDNVKSPENVGGVMRAAGVYGANLVVINGHRLAKRVRHQTNTVKAHRHVPVLHVEDVLEALPFDTVPIAVELLEGAVPLPRFWHPPRAFYIFGAEDQTLGRRITERCAHRVMVPTRHCMNLAACVNVVLYDRLAQGYAAAEARAMG